MRIAIVDIGTNTLLMTIAECTGDSITVLADEHKIARLGEGMDRSGIISEAACSRAESILRAYRVQADQLRVEYRVAVGTSVFRSTSNAAHIAQRLESIWGAPVVVLSGAREAELSYAGSVDMAGCTAVLDIGGGSTELTIGRDGAVAYRSSLEIGAVRLTEQFWDTYPASRSNLDAARFTIRNALKKLLAPIPFEKLYAVAGTPTTLALMAQRIEIFDWQRVDGYILTLEMVRSLCDCIFTASLDKLRSLPGVHPERADILPAGALILQEYMRWLDRDCVIVSAKGLRYGVLRAICNSQWDLDITKN